MTLSDAEILELNALCYSVVDGQTDDAMRARLTEWLQRSPEARRHYVRIMAQSASLHHYAAEMQADAPQPAPPSARRKLRWLIPAGILASLAIFLVMAHSFRTTQVDVSSKAVVQTSLELNDEAILSDGPEPVARLSGLMDCAWGGVAPGSGEDISRGSQLQLLKGLAEITFDSGARIVVEGPATFVVRSAWETELLQGSLKAQVPPEAIGFRVLHHAVSVVDLGTEFTMSAEEDGDAEVLVLKGSVEAQPEASPTERVLLNEKQGRRFSKSGVSDMHQREQKLAKWSRKMAIERPQKAFSIARWSSISLPSQTRPDSAQKVMSTPLQWQPVKSSADLLKGASTERTQALHLTGNVYADSPLPNSGSKIPRSIAFWIQVPADASPKEANPVLAIRSPDGSVHTELGWNTAPVQGPFGALRISTAHGYVVASTPLRDGKWHHVAALFGKARRSADKVQVRLYVDGRLEMISSAKKPLKRATHDLLIKSGSLWLGRTPATPAEASGFRGSVDDIVLADRVFTPDEVRALVRGSLPSEGAEDSL